MSGFLDKLPGQLPNPFSGGKIVGTGVSHDEYAKQPTGVKRGDPTYIMSRGSLIEFAACPHKWIQDVPEDVTAAMKWGSLIDCLLLTPDQFLARYAVTPLTYKNKKGEESDWRNDLRIEAVAKWHQDNAGKEAVKQTDLQDANRNVAAILKNPHIEQIVKCSDTQVYVTAEYKDNDTGICVPVRALLDLVPRVYEVWGKCLGDLKLTTNASQGAWTRKVWDSNYHVQAAFYSDIYRCAKPDEERTDWFNAVSEDAPPYESVVWMLSADFVELGRQKYIAALEHYCRCLKENVWPSYNDQPMSSFIQPAAYMLQ